VSNIIVLGNVVIIHVDRVRICVYTAATNGPFVHPPGGYGGMPLTGKTEEVGENPVPLPLCPSQIPHELTRTRTWASAEKAGD
jgi:hypothetical protein